MVAITTQWVSSVEQALPVACREARVSTDGHSVTFVFDDAECSLRLSRSSALGEVGVSGVFVIREAGAGLGSWWTRAQRSLPSHEWHRSGPVIAEWLASTLAEAGRLLSENGRQSPAADAVG